MSVGQVPVELRVEIVDSDVAQGRLDRAVEVGREAVRIALSCSRIERRRLGGLWIAARSATIASRS